MKVEQEEEAGITLLCSLSGHSRWAYYKRRTAGEREPLKEELIIQQVLSCRKLQPRIGGRKLFLLLSPFMKRHAISMGRDAFFELLGRYRLLNKRRRRKPRTTDSNHWMHKYPDLAKTLAPKRSDELWVSDITYLELSVSAAFLSLVTDAYSHKIVGYHLSDSLRAEGPLQALQMAIAGRGSIPGLTHHSDRGVQYCCHDYVELLKSCQVSISMTQGGDPRDNAIAERVNGILKMELLEPFYKGLEEARAAIAQAVNTYNYLRPHSSISMLAPAFVHGKKIQLKRKWKNYYKTKPAKEAVMDG